MRKLAQYGWLLAALLFAACHDDSTSPSSTVATVAISPDTATLYIGRSVQLTATAKNAAGTALTGRTATWATSDPSIATVSGDGLVTAVTIGAASITASIQGKATTARVSIVPVPVARVKMSRDTATIINGASLQLTATPTDSAGNALAGRNVDWRSSNTASLIVTATGSVIAVAPGAADITATSEGKAGVTHVAVVPVPVASISLAADTATLVPGATVQLTAVTRDSAGAVLSGRAVTWSTSDAPRATVSATGLVTAVAPGTATFTASAEGRSVTARVTIRDGGFVPTAGAAITAVGGAVTLAVPAGAVTQATSVVVDAARSAPSSAQLVMGTAFDIGPGDVSFSQPVVLSIRYAASSLTSGVAEEALRIYKATGGSWQLVSGGSVNASAKLVGATITSLGTYAILAPAQAARIALSRDVATLTAGATLAVTATAIDAEGNTLAQPAITWGTSNPTVASVSAAGLVTAIAPGQAMITASSGTATANLQLTVVLDPCGTTGGFSLQVGEMRTFAGTEAGDVCLAGGTQGAEYTLIPFNAIADGASSLTLSVKATGVSAVTGPPSPTRIGTGASQIGRTGTGGLLTAGPTRDVAFERKLRERTLRDITPRRFAAARARGPRPSFSREGIGTGGAAKVGDLVTLNAQGEYSCSSPIMRTGRITAISAGAIVVADTGNPTGGFTDEDYRSLATTFDTLVNPVDTLNFGAPSDIDGNGRVIIFFTREVNALTPANSSSYIGGFFFARDLVPKTGASALDRCDTSNEAEMFYLLAPDPKGTVNGNVRTTSFVKAVTPSVIAHEYQHLINASRRMYVNHANTFEVVWLDEGLAHVAEELTFYRASHLAPRQNITLEKLRSDQSLLDAVNAHQAANLGRYSYYLFAPEWGSPIALDDELSTRGATWSFLRYAADRKIAAGLSSEVTFWRTLVNSLNSGVVTLRGAIGSDPVPWIQDWTTAVYLDDAVPGVASKFTMPSWNFRSVLPGLALNAGRFPMKVTTLSTSATAVVEIMSGSAAYLRAAVPPASTGRVLTTTSANLSPSSTLVMTVVRTK